MSARSMKRAREREIRRLSSRRKPSIRAAVATGAAIGASAVFGVPAAAATTFPVTNNTDAGAGSLRGAVLAANANAGPDVVDATGVSGTITLTSGSPIPVTDAVTINGPGRANLTLSGDSNGNNHFDPYDDTQVFDFNPNSVATFPATISGMTISKGTGIKYVPTGPSSGKYIGLSGGAIGATNTNLTISGSALTDNYATGGGGAIYTGGTSSLTVTGSIISGNTASESGGGIEAFLADPGAGAFTVENSYLAGNHTNGAKYSQGPNDTFNGNGGAIQVTASSATITLSTIVNNTAADFTSGPASTFATRGGGINFGGGGTNKLSDSTVANNTVQGNGGGVGVTLSDRAAKLDLENSTISGNRATSTAAAGTGSGGGLYNDAYSRIDPNPPNGPLGSGTVNVKNSTIAGNTAAAQGGGVFEAAAVGPGASPTPAANLSSTIVADNTPNDLQTAAPSSGFIAGRSLIESTGGAFALNSSPAGSNIFGLDPKLGGLANNGGPTLTRMPAATSPVLDAGIANGFATDQRGAGFPRTIKSSAPSHKGSDGTDIGAVERKCTKKKKKKKHGKKASVAKKKHKKHNNCKKKKKKKKKKK